ncbi:turret protein [Fako virus]|uniref:Turret protein n=1 Tax=Fako virus TaxID=1567404 RepID=A0A0A0U955_9REOV|nr:turret protein [Fako virus]6DJY_D Chain D, Turret protein [Fako virus]AIW39860.1 turret protein [Fako virus]AIW39861.1 turret protein [Fako virus]AIW39862.1 turret protein [Fako virus]AIW39863.1 turret protein [Fako virus]
MIDLRLEEDILTATLPEFLSTRPKYRYAYTNTKQQDIRFQGPMRHVRLTHLYKQTKLWNLQYIERELAISEIDDALDEFIQTFSLPYVIEQGTYKYNMLLGMHAHNVNYQDDVSELIANNPQLLNYLDDNPFSAIFELVNVDLQIYQYGQNIFNNEAEHTILFLKDNTNYGVIQALQKHPFSATHINWHLHKHIFVFHSREQLLNKLLSAGLEDSQLYQRQKTYSTKRGDRPTERMVTYIEDDHIRRIQAVFPLLLDNIFDVKLHKDSSMTWLKSYADMIYDSVKNSNSTITPEIRKLYLRMYNQYMRIFLPIEQYMLYDNTCWPFSEKITLKINVRLISSRENQPVLWKTPIDTENLISIVQPDEPINKLNFTAIPSTMIRLNDNITMYRAVKDMFSAIEYLPDAIENIPTLTMKEQALSRYISPDSEAQNFFNNQPPYLNSIMNVNRQVFEAVKRGNIQVSTGSMEHLCLCMHVKSGLIVGRTVLIDDKVVLRRNFNASTAKMITCYVKAFAQLYGEGSLINPGLRMVFFGVETEPAIDILKLFYGDKSLYIQGFGDRGIGRDKFRTKIEDALTLRIGCDILISDIDQADYEDPNEEKFDDITDFVCYVTELVISNATVGLVKISMPTYYIMNKISSTLNNKFSNVAINIVKLSTQKPYTYEAYIMLSHGSTLTNKGYLRNPVCDVYLEKISLQPMDLKIISTISNEINYDKPTLYRFVVDKNDVTDVSIAMHILSIHCSTITTRSVMVRSDNTGAFVTMSGIKDMKRVAIMNRMTDGTSANSYMHEQNGKLYLQKVPYLEDLISAFPNGFGSTYQNDYDSSMSVINVNALIRQVVYRVISKSIPVALLESLSRIRIIGGRDLGEMNAVYKLYKTPIEVYDAVGITREYPHVQISYRAQRYSFTESIPNHTLLLANYVIMNDVDGAPISSLEQINTIKKIISKISLGSIAYIQVYTDIVARNINVMTKNDSFLISANADKTVFKVQVSGYKAVEMCNYEQLLQLVSDNTGVNIIKLTYQDVLESCVLSSGILGDTGSWLLDLVLASTYIIEIRG